MNRRSAKKPIACKKGSPRSADVARLIHSTRRRYDTYSKLLRADEAMLSINKVTGCSLNFPIAATCSPTKVCATTCYFARGSSTWPNSLKKQYRLLNTVKADPIAAAQRLEHELKRKWKKPSFVRWNGGGDLFPESVVFLNDFARRCPWMPIWVVTRIPALAAQIDDAPNVFIHFSLDAHSLERRVEFERLSPRSKNYFFSYQSNHEEEPDHAALQGISVLFYHCYTPPEHLPAVATEVICPLNTEADITGVCDRCRRCFDGSAVSHRLRNSKPATARSTRRRARTSQPPGTGSGSGA